MFSSWSGAIISFPFDLWVMVNQRTLDYVGLLSGTARGRLQWKYECYRELERRTDRYSRLPPPWLLTVQTGIKESLFRGNDWSKDKDIDNSGVLSTKAVLNHLTADKHDNLTQSFESFSLFQSSSTLNMDGMPRITSTEGNFLTWKTDIKT